MKPKVSVLIPTYNRADKVCKSVESVLAQSYADLEVIVVDDGSSDDTDKTLVRIFGDRIRYFYQANCGVSKARNKGIEEARGEWIAFLDSDDLWENDKLEWQFKALERFAPDCGACYTDVRFYNHAETRTMFQLAAESYLHEGVLGVNCDVFRILIRPGGAGMLICPSSFMARTDVVRKTGRLNPKLRYQQDTEFMFRVAMHTEFCYVNRPLVWFDRSPVETRHKDQLVPGVPRKAFSTDWDRIEVILEDSDIWLNGLLQLSGVPDHVRNLIREQQALVDSGLANCYLIDGQIGKAQTAACRSMQNNFTFNVAVKWMLTRISPGIALRTVCHRKNKRASSFAI
jgi:glycosyltransferase involved in cell wall biosynthesis